MWMAATLTDTSFFYIYRSGARANTAYLCRCVALSALLALLASRARRLRAPPWTLAGLNAAACALTLALELTHAEYTDDLSALLRYLPFQITGALGLGCIIVGAWLLWRSESRFYRAFAPLASAALAALALGAALLDGATARTQLMLALSGETAAISYFLQPASSAAALAAAVSAVVEIVGQELERRLNARQLADRGKLALASYESLRSQHEQVMMIRHDFSRHLHVLRQLSTEAAVQRYLDELIGQNESIPAALSSGNQMIDIMLNGRLASASAAGIDVSILSAQAPSELPLSDADLCSLMLNIVDNAIAAASAPGLEHPRICVDLRVKGSYFVFACENTFDADGRAKSGGQGLGARIIESIVERYDCLMDVERRAGTYKATIAMPVK